MKRICGAHARSAGKPCQASVVPGRTRYRRHGGLSTGPRTSEGKKRISDAKKRRWAAYRKKEGGRVVGRRMAGGAAEALPPAEFDAIAKAATGEPAAVVAQHTLGRDVGRTRVHRDTKRPLA